MSEQQEPYFKIGDLVTGCYDFDDMLYYSVFGRVTQEIPQHVGVVVDISSETFYFGEYVYTVLCVDGNKRFFLREELVRL